MLTRGSSKQYLRATVDVEPTDVELLEELEEKANFSTRRDVFITGLRLISMLFRARRRGLRPQLIDPQSSEVVEVDWQNLLQIEPFQPPRRLHAAKVSEPIVRLLRARAAELQDADLNRVSATITQAVWDPSGKGNIDTSILAELIVITLGLRDHPLLSVTRDLLTQLCTSSKSFDDLLALAVHGYRPSFDGHRIEHRFLWDEYRRELPIKYPSGHAALRAKGVL